MTDAELATLKPGDRVRMRLLPGLPDGVVRAIDRRHVLVALDEGTRGDFVAADLDLVRSDAQLPVEDSSLPSLESRWRALTDEVLVALRRLVAAGQPLDDLIVRFAADESRASAEIHRLHTEGETAKVTRVATCAVGVDVMAPEPPR